MQASHNVKLKLIPLLFKRTKIKHLFPQLQSGSLISIKKICDDGFTSTFTFTYMIVEKKGNLVIEVTCTVFTGMWHVNLIGNIKF